MTAVTPVLTPMSRDEFIRLYMDGGTLRSCACALGLNSEEMALALMEAQYRKITERLTRKPEPFVESDPRKTWCDQCQSLVREGEFMACRSDWCKARNVA